ncbi:hypothetical protein AVEN_162760-1 [Araneus ventricosus]|uniref:Uncharacterized protein n=1 Tax=Araneus ventricosus TaxID=182803 RepID=A0A4Y2V204_ARAVE|nr:hypothetical protein AVEN_162760-1 [Araneus ventricosus]
MSKIIRSVFGSRILQRKYDSMYEPLCKDRFFCLAARGSFRQDGDVIFCNDVDSLFKALELQHNPQEWRLFIDSSKVSLKVVVLHNGSKHPSVPENVAVRMKETYETLKHMLSSIEYSNHSRHICADLKVIAVLVRLQGGYTKFFCFLCQWDSRDRKKVLHQEGVAQATVPHTGCEE